MIINDEIHGTIEFDELEGRVIDSMAFQRLRRIKQMSVTNLVYPGANHSRFEHSVGTAHLSDLIARRLGLDDDEAKKVKIYGLLHDIGHTPFSHEGEHILRKYVGDHEERGRKKMMEGEIGDILSENYRPSEIADVGKSAHGNIVESDLGADRMDYLKRDAQNTGVAYGIIDIERIVHTLAMEEDQLCIEKGGLAAAEYLLVARFMMFSTVYLHKTVRIATAMLYRAVDATVKDGVDAGEFAEMDDETAMLAMLEHEGSRYAEGLLKRKLYKEVYSLPKEGVGAEKLEKELSAKHGCDVIVDLPHTFFKPVGFRIKTDEGLVAITKISKLLQSLKKAEEERMKVLVLAEEEDSSRIRQGMHS